MTTSSFNTVSIDSVALRDNYRQLTALVGPGVRIMAMVKSEAYGHGLVPTARVLARAGCRAFGVAEVEEGVRLRKAGIDGDILVTLGAGPETAAEAIRHRLQLVVYDQDMVRRLHEIGVGSGQPVGVHLKVDLGMGRLGITAPEIDDMLRLLRGAAGVELLGVMSHFPLADSDRQGQTRGQLATFQTLQQNIAKLFPRRPVAHIANSAALCRYPESHCDMVRPGIALYGCYPCPEARGAGRPRLRPVMSFTTRVVQVKTVPAGTGISYGHRFVTRQTSRLAVLPVGYDDGYLRRLSGRAVVLIRGRRLPVLGTICMNACVVDCTGCPEVAVGDEVVLMGRQGAEEISADTVAGWLDTINYEVLCLFGNRNQRRYLSADSPPRAESRAWTTV